MQDAPAHAICVTLNKFDEALQSRLSVYPSFFKIFHKVDSFMVTDVSESQRSSTTKDIVNLAFDLRTEVIIFEVTHKPGTVPALKKLIISPSKAKFSYEINWISCK